MRPTMTFLRLADGVYQEQPLDHDGRYRPAHLPGLTCVLAHLWDTLFHPDYAQAGDCHVFERTAPPTSATLPRPWQVARADELGCHAIRPDDWPAAHANHV